MREKFTDQRQRLARISQLEAHQHHQAKAEEQERETAQTVLNPDHLVIGGENIFSPPTKLMVFVFASVCVWVVMRFDRSRRIHFRRKLSFQYLEGSAVCKAEKHFRGQMPIMFIDYRVTPCFVPPLFLETKRLR